MSYAQFISNLEGLNDGQDFPKDLLKVSQQIQTSLHKLPIWHFEPGESEKAGILEDTLTHSQHQQQSERASVVQIRLSDPRSLCQLAFSWSPEASNKRRARTGFPGRFSPEDQLYCDVETRGMKRGTPSGTVCMTAAVFD